MLGSLMNNNKKNPRSRSRRPNTNRRGYRPIQGNSPFGSQPTPYQTGMGGYKESSYPGYESFDYHRPSYESYSLKSDYGSEMLEGAGYDVAYHPYYGYPLKKSDDSKTLNVNVTGKPPIGP